MQQITSRIRPLLNNIDSIANPQFLISQNNTQVMQTQDPYPTEVLPPRSKRMSNLSNTTFDSSLSRRADPYRDQPSQQLPKTDSS